MNKDVLEIVNGLTEKSEQKKVIWVHASSVNALNLEYPIELTSEDFAVHSSTYTINIFRRTKDNGVGINIHNDEGTLVTSEMVTPDDPDHKIADKLLGLARKYALGEDKLLREITESLKKPGVIGGDNDEFPF